MTITIAHVKYEIAKKQITVITALLLSIVVLASNVNAAEPILVLDPSSGDPPSMNGILSGSGWLCDSGAAPVGSATVSGVGVVGSASINRDGSLSGSFTVRGDVGHVITVTVTSSEYCPSTRTLISLQASAIFTFNTPTPIPTRTAIPTPSPTATLVTVQTATPSPQPTATTVRMPTATTTPAPTVPPAGPPKPFITGAPAIIEFIGCSPSIGKVQAKFDPVNVRPGIQTFTVPTV